MNDFWVRSPLSCPTSLFLSPSPTLQFRSKLLFFEVSDILIFRFVNDYNFNNSYPAIILYAHIYNKTRSHLGAKNETESVVERSVTDGQIRVRLRMESAAAFKTIANAVVQNIW